MAKLSERNSDSAPGDWYIDNRCIDCGASRDVAPGLVVLRKGKSVFARQPANEEEERAAWRAVLVCPTASVGTESHRVQPAESFSGGARAGRLSLRLQRGVLFRRAFLFRQT